MDKILAVCANGDKTPNLVTTKWILDILINRVKLPDKTYELISMNPEKVIQKLVYSQHIEEKFPSQALKDKDFSVVIFQGCMTCSSNLVWTKEISVFTNISEITRILNDNGLFIVFSGCYWHGKKNIRKDVENLFTFLQTYNRDKQEVGMPYSIDIWRKK